MENQVPHDPNMPTACENTFFDGMPNRHDANDFASLVDMVCGYAAYYAHTSGFHDVQLTHDPNPTIRMLSHATKLMLMVTETAEAMEALRHDPDAPSDAIPSFTQMEEELADAVIRIFDMAGTDNLRLGEAILAKMAHNKTRPHLHGGKKA